MDIDDQLDSLHLSEVCHRKKRRLSGVFMRKEKNKPSIDNIDNIDSPSLEVENMPILEEELETSSDIPEKLNIRRSGRKTRAPVRWDSQSTLTTRNMLNINNLAAIEKYYLDKTVKRTTTSLETIFEEVQENKNHLHNVMSVRKLRRSMNFSEISRVPPGKIKRRKLKAAKISTRKSLSIESTLDDLYKNYLQLEKTDK
ncbi:hypothetical protein HHI36_008264 [Cryptolaemus montrouzieri]|uniref:Tantalus-like domain-containing protein n=1 Tax=Cryptolaemus montrouzieri TaxID=559131 RepID=A0ABD2MSQ9_9CUCU